ncbi:MAG: Na+/H+ antiporter subunit D [Phycisphaeraceae bacterium]|nr:Na+/H+ antiporter subunit D [Phycisphaeraceae bacterium]
MNLLVVTPVLVPLLTAVLTALWRVKPALQRTVSFIGMAALLASAVALVAITSQGTVPAVAFGNWEAPFGIQFQIDRLGAIMVLLTAIMGAASLLFMLSDADTRPQSPLLLPLLHGMLAGVGGAFATADLFNMYVWFEVMLIGVLGLFALGGRLDQLDATFRYLALNLVGTLLLVISVGAIYSVTGHLNFTAVHHAVQALPPGMTTLLLGTLMLAFLIKAGAFPLFAWLPASYHTLPGPVLALCAGLLTKVGVYALLRMCGDVFEPTPKMLLDALGWIAAATMLFGVLGAAYHWDLRRILGFHIISQIGYMLLGIALGTATGDGGALFYTAHHIIVKANLFLIAAMIWRLTGSYDLRKIGGLYDARPMLGLVFAIPALSLVGIPPLSGFWAKLLVLSETIALGHITWTVVALIVSFLTLYSMMKIWLEAFWKRHPDSEWHLPANTRLGPAWITTITLALITISIGVAPQILISFVMAAAEQMGGGR